MIGTIPRDPELDRLMEEARKKVDSMTPEEFEAMLDVQRKSFVRAMTTPCEHGVLDFESCSQCRGKET